MSITGPLLHPTADRRNAAPRHLRLVPADTLPSSPPPEVEAAIATAAATWKRLADTGRAVRFGIDDVTGRVQAELTDGRGGPGRRLTGAEALAFAAGEPPEGSAA